MFKILMTYSNTEGMSKLLKNKNFKVDIVPRPTPEKFKEIVKDYDGLCIRSEVKVTKEIIDVCKNMKLIARAGTGVDNIDLKSATEKGIIVMNVPGGNTISACEQTMALMLALARNTPQAHNSLKSGQWQREKYVGTELQGKTLGLIGLGRIGKEVAKRALAFEMNVIAYDPFVSEDFMQSIGIKPCSLDELYSKSDFISIHTPKNESTKNMINSESIKKMKKGVRIINCARGGIINEADLYEALKTGHIKGAALDVFEKEPPGPDCPLMKLENVIVTPHLGASTEEAQIKIAQEISDMVIDFFEKGIIRNAVNIPSIDFDTYQKQRPYLELIDDLGSFLGQIVEGGIKQVNLEYAGEIPGNTFILTLSFLKGLLTPILDIKVNFVNAQVIARERGIKLIETKKPESEDYTSIITATVKTDKEESTVSATLFSHKIPRIVNINGINVDIVPQGYMILLKNEDKPGIIGKIGTLLGNSQINIASMQVGRRTTGGEAITIVNVDNSPSDEVSKKISDIDGIRKVKIIKI